MTAITNRDSIATHRLRKALRGPDNGSAFPGIEEERIGLGTARAERAKSRHRETSGVVGRATCCTTSPGIGNCSAGCRRNWMSLIGFTDREDGEQSG